MADDNQEKFDAAATRFARALAPLISAQIHYTRSRGEEPPSVADLLHVNIGQVVSHFATVDGSVSGAEARAYEKVVGLEAGKLSTLVESAGSITSGPIMDIFKRMSADSRFESAVGSSISLLHGLHGMDTVKEYVLSLRALGAATCNLDGRSDAESQALQDLDELLKSKLAELE